MRNARRMLDERKVADDEIEIRMHEKVEIGD
jgi:hypothetical protein